MDRLNDVGRSAKTRTAFNHGEREVGGAVTTAWEHPRQESIVGISVLGPRMAALPKLKQPLLVEHGSAALPVAHQGRC